MAYDELLADPKEAEDRFGLHGVTEQGMRIASGRIRSYTRQQITAGISTVTTNGLAVRLVQRPFKELLSVTDKAGNPVQYRQQGDTVTTRSTGGLTVTYRHGLNSIPDDLRGLIHTIAQRVSRLDGSAGQMGIQQESSHSESVSYSKDHEFGATGLLLAEMNELNRWFPRLPRTHWQGH